MYLFWFSKALLYAHLVHIHGVLFLLALPHLLQGSGDVRMLCALGHRSPEEIVGVDGSYPCLLRPFRKEITQTGTAEPLAKSVYSQPLTRSIVISLHRNPCLHEWL
jgi:hypothetical protein